MNKRSNEEIYRVLGISRQGLHQYLGRQERLVALLDQAELQLLDHREDHGGLGLRKAYYQIQPQGLGRKTFIDEMTIRGHALRVKRSQMRTTQSGDRRFPNLIIGLIINAVNLIWQSDTTYFRQGERFYYLTFIIDVYSRLIVGYCVSKDLRATANVAALKMALATRAGQDMSQLIFHSDGGVQYLYGPFLELLRQRQISSSMCREANNNAYAEKLNDVIKNEYLAYKQMDSLEQLKKVTEKAIHNYNHTRLHGQLPLHSRPVDFERYLCSPDAQEKRPLLLIRDGQAPYQEWEQPADQNLHHPCIWASKGVKQILPAHVVLPPPESQAQLILDF